MAVATPAPTEAPPAGDANPLCTAGPFELEGAPGSYECALDFPAGSSDGQGRLAWTHNAEAATVDFALSLPANGWISVGFTSAENAASMVGSIVSAAPTAPSHLTHMTSRIRQGACGIIFLLEENTFFPGR